MKIKITFFLIFCLVLVVSGTAAYLFLNQEKEMTVAPVIEIPVVSGDESGVSSEVAPFFLTTMTHMESGFTDDKLEDVFLRHVEEVRYAMDLADLYDAKLTIESEEPFARASEIWGVNILAEVLARGHGVGTHCDVPPTPEKHGPKNTQELILEMRERKELVDALVGAENNYGCSGAGGMQDWVQGAAGAGFHYIDGIVGFHYLAMPLSARPDGWTDDYILETAFHYNAPYDLEDRIYPRLLVNALDFEEDQNGTVLASAGDLGKLSWIKEGDEYCRDGGECVLDKQDVDALVELLEDIDSSRDTSRIAKVSIYFAAVDFMEENGEVFEYFFAKMQDLQEGGIITWATQKEVYDAFMNQ